MQEEVRCYVEKNSRKTCAEIENQLILNNGVSCHVLPVSQQPRKIAFTKTPLTLYQEKIEAEKYWNRLNDSFEDDDIQTELGELAENYSVQLSDLDLYETEEEKLYFIEDDDDECRELQTSMSETSETSEPSKDLYQDNGVCAGSKNLNKHYDKINFDDVCGLVEAKKTLKNVFIYPIQFPQLFPGNICWNRILLYGPPGTGKSMLAKAIAKEINCTLHKISSADLLSHWQGETEKQIRCLFEEVRSSGETSILFFDEIDGLCRRRTSNEDDLVRRIKTELLIQFEENSDDVDARGKTYIVGATNCPWDIDSAFMRRFHRKIYIPLPDKAARIDILRKGFDKTETSLTDCEWNEAGEKTEGYSGSDLINVVMAACCERLSQMMNCQHWIANGDIWIPALPNSLFSTRLNFEDIPRHKIGCRGVNFKDIEAAIANTTKSVSPAELEKYSQFSLQFR